MPLFTSPVLPGIAASESHRPLPGIDSEDPAVSRAWLRLAYSEGIGPVRGAALLRHFRDPQAVFDAPRAEVAAITGSLRASAALLDTNPERDAAVEAALAWRDAAPDRRLLALGDTDYPQRLLDLTDPPLVLHAEGRIECLRRPQIAIVGSRQASAGGLDTAHGLAAALAPHGFTVTSGLAEGIDGAAHRGALDGGGLTVAALGTGIDRIYPPAHEPLAARIRARGVLITELAPGMLPLPANFPRRNRLIAALAQAVIVVEAALRSGSLITARLAADLGRDVLAVPGSIHTPRARGCHRLLRDGAALVETVDDVLAALGGTTVACAACAPDIDRTPAPSPHHSPEAARLLDLLAADALHLDRLVAHLDRPAGAVLALAQMLEIDGHLRRLDDGRFIRR